MRDVDEMLIELADQITAIKNKLMAKINAARTTAELAVIIDYIDDLSRAPVFSKIGPALSKIANEKYEKLKNASLKSYNRDTALRYQNIISGITELEVIDFYINYFKEQEKLGEFNFVTPELMLMAEQRRNQILSNSLNQEVPVNPKFKPNQPVNEFDFKAIRVKHEELDMEFNDIRSKRRANSNDLDDVLHIIDRYNRLLSSLRDAPDDLEKTELQDKIHYSINNAATYYENLRRLFESMEQISL